jgi:hypothetical protein
MYDLPGNCNKEITKMNFFPTAVDVFHKPPKRATNPIKDRNKPVLASNRHFA